jgi:hypothetical protein
MDPCYRGMAESIAKILKVLSPHYLSMKGNAVNLTTAKIISILNEHRSKSKQGYIQIRLENVGGCKGSEMKLKLHTFYDGKTFIKIISDCLSLDEIGKIHEAIENFCKQNTINMH